MKKISVALLLAVFSFASCDKETIVQHHDLPKEINNFVTTHFPDNKIIQSVKDRDGLELTYDVILENNIKLEFNNKKQIIDIESRGKLPESAIPTTISKYVATHYADNYITGWELDDRKQQVTLNNGLELEFNLSGEFLRIDL